MCIDIVEVSFGIAHWKILSLIDRVICLPNDNGGILSFDFYICFSICFFIHIFVFIHIFINILAEKRNASINSGVVFL